MLTRFAAAHEKVNKETGVISGVSVITCGVEAIGHGVYTDGKTLSTVKACAETAKDGVQVKMNHRSGFSDIVGVLKNFRVELANERAMGDPIGQCDCLRADLHLLKSHPAFNQICEMSETMPGSFGLSISFRAATEKIDDMDFVRCAELYSVDLVDSPAANPNGLFSKSVDSETILKTMITELKDLWAKLGDTITALSAKPEAKELDSIKASLTELGAKISTELSAAQADLATAKASIESLSKDKLELTGKADNFSASLVALDSKLTETLAALNVEAKADASAIEKLAALETFAKVAGEKAAGTPAEKIPAPGVKAEGKTVSRAEFEKMSQTDRNNHFKSGGKITE